MAMPNGIGVIDAMMSIPPEPGDMSWLEALRPLLRDEESLSTFKFPAEYMFKNLPAARFAADAVSAVLHEMDRFGIERTMIGVSFDNDRAIGALRAHHERFFGSYEVDPNLGAVGVRDVRRAVEELDVRAATAFPSVFLSSASHSASRSFCLSDTASNKRHTPAAGRYTRLRSRGN